MSKTIEVTPAQASELMAEGYTVRCYLELGSPVRKKPRKTYTQKMAKVSYSVEGKHPVKGKIAAVWAKTCKELWGKNVALSYTREEVDAALAKHGNTDTGAFSYLLRAGAIRLVNVNA